MKVSCQICGRNRGLDQHHVAPKRMGGTVNPDVLDEANLMTLCRQCHEKIHEGRWEVVLTPKGVEVLDTVAGQRVMRRLRNTSIDIPKLFHLLNLSEASFISLFEALPFLEDDQLIEAFGYASSFGKRAWLVQAAILYEAQQRSTYGDHTLEAIARRFNMGIRQAQKYALVWGTFFLREHKEEYVNIDAIVLDEPSWYVVAATETDRPEQWLAYAQDRKISDPRYTVAALRREIVLARFMQGVADAKAQREDEATLNQSDWRCPWARLSCVKSGNPVLLASCRGCEFEDFTGSQPSQAMGDVQ